MNFSLDHITDSLSENFLYHVALLALFIGTKKKYALLYVKIVLF